MRGLLRWLVGAFAVVVPGMALALECGETDIPCQVPGGEYFVALPEDAEPTGLVIWLHGFNGSGARAAANAGFTRNFRAAGLAFVAPHGRGTDATGTKRRDWGVRDGHPPVRDDLQFLAAVLEDAQSRQGLRGAPVLLAGFSRGGSMAWDAACAMPERFDGVAAVAGGFWEPFRATCTGPVHLFHTHGFKDRMVPLEGRQVTWAGRDYHQGNILKGLDIWRATNGCMGAAEQNKMGATLWEKRWTGCAQGSITLQLSTGGHGIPKGWSGRVMEWFAALPGVASQ